MSLHNDTSLELRLAAARARRRRTLGERVLRALGNLLALLALALAWSQAQGAGAAGAPSACTLPAPAAGAPRVLLVASDMSGLRQAQTVALQESIATYFGVVVQALPLREYQPGAVASHDLLVVLGNALEPGAEAYTALLAEAAQRALPLAWIGVGSEALAGRFGLETGTNAAVAAPAGTELDYKGARIPAGGLVLARALRPAAGSSLREAARLRLPDGSERSAVLAGPGTVIVGFLPFRDLTPQLLLAAAIDALSPLLGPHRSDPRVLLRLEDLNGRDYGWRDRSFDATAELLLAENVFMHLSLIPLMMDAAGKRVADIGDARPVLRLIQRHPQAVELIQHGGQHFRASPRNHGLGSGAAYEFFFDDDATLGPQAAQALVRERLQVGTKVLARHGLRPRLFEVPHYTMSPAQQIAAAELFPAMHHSPLHHAGVRSQLLLPWPTQRAGTSYAPSVLGYVSIDDPGSVAGILRLLEPLAKVLPDPVVVIQYHPFMTRTKGREHDLGELVRGIKRLGYRFASTCTELARPAASFAAPPLR